MSYQSARSTTRRLSNIFRKKTDCSSIHFKDPQNPQILNAFLIHFPWLCGLPGMTLGLPQRANGLRHFAPRLSLSETFR